MATYSEEIDELRERARRLGDGLPWWIRWYYRWKGQMLLAQLDRLEQTYYENQFQGILKHWNHG